MNNIQFLSTKVLLLITLSATLLACGGSDSSSPTFETSSQASSTPLPVNSHTRHWQMVWNDEFDGPDIDLGKWSHEVNCWGGGNNEQQCYTDRAINSFIDDGMLNIVARREQFTGPATPDGSAGNNATLPYTSARLRSMNKGDWKYGRFEIRAKLPEGQGTWPAIWMLPTDYVYGGWAASGEIDIMEAVNLKTQSDEAEAPPGTSEARVHGTLHYGRSWPDNVNSGTDYKLPNGVNPADDFHVYAVEWEAGEIRWYVDDHHFATQRESGWYSQFLDESGTMINGPTGSPFDQKFHMLLNLAVGGAWAGNVNEKGIDESVFPQTLVIDYVRVYECAVSPTTGAGCANLGNSAELVAGNTAPPVVDSSSDYGSGPVYTLYNNGVTEGLELRSYNPDNQIAISEVAETNRGSVLRVDKTGVNGNVYFAYPPRVDLSDFAAGSTLIFELKVVDNSVSNPATSLLIKIDSGWPNVSDIEVPIDNTNEWSEIRISVTELATRRNSLANGIATLSDIINPFVIEPTGAISLLIDNIRFTTADGDTTTPTIPPSPKAQVDLPVTFEDEQVDYSRIDFGGVSTILTSDPTGAAGRVAMTTRTQNAETWAGTTMSTRACSH
ncbi:glycoside hydrolase family 16 protein [Agarilytica rhodophyticola]|uniref:glycoside hydrolase family 16 protein n=1 Tax=Agarilytica rhodophyticola TaxID=1737490 RepID=UPI000B3429A1|nr:glycoside hydrolase family 16 protein [Agarilytica rhodophyticola]